MDKTSGKMVLLAKSFLISKRFEKWKGGMGVSKLKIWWVYCVPKDTVVVGVWY